MDSGQPLERQCKARSKQSGQRCKRHAIHGGVVCVMHGGGAPHVKEAARIRLAELVSPAIKRLSELLRQKADRKVALGAARDILDRNDLTGKTQIEHSGSITAHREMTGDELAARAQAIAALISR